MDLKEYKNLWVFIEQENNEPKNVGLELLNEAKRMAVECGQEVWAMVIGEEMHRRSCCLWRRQGRFC